MISIFMVLLLLLLLFIVATIGWFIGYRYKTKGDSSFSLIPHDYFLGLNYLINEQPDKAVDVFIKMLEVNTDTVETHLALGSLFRRRGEVDRAIRIHQNLIARPQLARKQRTQALFELAQDYLRAGVLDRAERLFLELIEVDGEMINSLNSLIHIYQQQKEWQHAINMANKLEKLGKIDMKNAIAHYYCELAEQELHGNRNERAFKYLKEALKKDKRCVRASIMLGKVLMVTGKHKEAISTLRYIQKQDSDYMFAAISLLADCYRQISKEDEFISYLSDCIAEKPNIFFIIEMVNHIRHQEGNMAAINYLSQKIKSCTSLRGLKCMLELYINTVDPEVKNQLLLFEEFFNKFLEQQPVYRCIHCGFSGRQLYWQCPSCKRWNVIKPIFELENSLSSTI